MANVIDQYELNGLREDADNLLGLHVIGGNAESLDQAKTLVNINRILDRGVLNTTTKKYDAPVTEVIYAGAARISPVTYRRDRQEIGGMEAVRIRQYRGVLPWDVGDIHIDDYLIVNFSEDPDMVGKILDVTDVLYESELTMRRISLVDTSKDTTGLDC